ncbi:MAG: hypothetical protein COB67_06650 [SAR324 cluster bacterium]|uniref:Diguanylate cyclase response regulator n=1 Tax=SAR324 cluster bacterium TaxID=2024889 RepID=A0A2A4T4K6_9DELT|nr:MAG: hypothetical protein COB67_06650 [SAR324 cluster bacterium]
MNWRILVIDDEQNIRSAFIALLSPPKQSWQALGNKLFEVPDIWEETPLDVITSSQGQEGLQLVETACDQDHPFFLIFIDMRMPPGWDGLKTAQEILKIDPDVNIVLITAYADNKPDSFAEELGVADKLFYIKKPFEPAEIKYFVSGLVAAGKREHDLKQTLCEQDDLVESLSSRQQDTLKRCDLVEKVNLQLQQTNQYLESLASIDELTGIYNRRYLLEQMQKEWARSRRYQYPIALILFDVDHFKLFNDHYGHQTGDQVLRLMAQTSQSILRDSDIMGRYGGEEFLIMLPETSVFNAALVAEKIRALVEKLEFTQEGDKLRIAVSLGVAGRKKETRETMESVIQRVDQAMYQAKHAGRNQVYICRQKSPSNLAN